MKKENKKYSMGRFGQGWFLGKSKENDTCEDGRSMVEMLGVLAIIGVLSIGGIAGYTIAMNKYKANEIMDKAAKLFTAIEASPYARMYWRDVLNATDNQGYKSVFQTLGMNDSGVLVSYEPEGVYEIDSYGKPGIKVWGVSAPVAKALRSMGVRVGIYDGANGNETTVFLFERNDYF